MVYDGYVEYEEAEIHRSAIMQDFRDSEKKKKKNIYLNIKNGSLAAILDFFV